MPKLELALLVGAESKEWLQSLEAVADRLEKLAKNGIAAKVVDKGEDEKMARPIKGKRKVDEEEAFDLGAEEEPAYTLKDVVAACRANREEAIAVLKKLKVKSVQELKPVQYPKVLAALGA